MGKISEKLWSPKRKIEEFFDEKKAKFMKSDKYFKAVSALFVISILINFAIFGFKTNLFLTVIGIFFTVMLNLKLLAGK